ncbi:MAG TPA: efflux RND transporter periplasmic adaptor subunit [Telluria sp.]|nr:efflux RND transporter periplasmic adaptor subunit [Telluria sp.]
MKKKAIAGILGAIVIVAGAAYVMRGSAPAAPAQRGKGGAQGPVLVNVVKPQRQDVPVVEQSNGTVTAVSMVDLHPQTTATIRKVHIREGQFVKAGDLMFTLDDRADQAGVEKAQAQVARDQAALADVERQYRRAQELFAQKFIAQSQVDTLRSQVEAARALLAADVAAAKASRVSASYTAIRAPMTGRVGAINVYPGSLVQLATSLTTVTQLDPIHVSFTLPEHVLGDLLAAQRAGVVPVEAAAGGAAPVQGKLSFIDNAVDPAAGTIKVKAQFDNRANALWPGQYVTAKVTVRTLKDAVVIPQTAVVNSVRGTFVYAVGADQTAVQVPVQRVHAFGLNTVVTGLKGDELVITEGKQNLRPGGKIRIAQENTGAPAGKRGRKGAPA